MSEFAIIPSERFEALEKDIEAIKILAQSSRLQQDANGSRLPLISLKRLMKDLDISKTKIYQLIDSGRLEAKYIDRKIFFLVGDIVKLAKSKTPKN